MSEHRVEVVRLGPIEKHPNADSLGIVKVWAYTAIVRLGEWSEGDLAAYVEPDYVVPDVEQFAFLAGHRRIKAKRLRGTWSQGLLIRPPEGAREGDDVMEALGIVRYEPKVHAGMGAGGDSEPAHPTLAGIPKYDLENWRRYNRLLEPGEPVVITEKIHGANARYAFREGRMWCGSRTMWKLQDERSIWWKALAAAPWIEDFCRKNEDAILYGEVFGQVQDLKYGTPPGVVRFLAFDVLRGNVWLDAEPFEAAFPAECRVPILYRGPFDPVAAEELSRCDSRLAPHLAEGIVIRPAIERTDPRLGRVVLKIVSDRYMERAS